MKHLLDLREIQRLLDGSLPEKERLALLEWIDEQPHQWRNVALAFVEEQVLRSAVRGMRTPTRADDRPLSIVAMEQNQTRQLSRNTKRKRRVVQAVLALLLLGAGMLIGRSTVEAEQAVWQTLPPETMTMPEWPSVIVLDRSNLPEFDIDFSLEANGSFDKSFRELLYTIKADPEQNSGWYLLKDDTNSYLVVLNNVMDNAWHVDP